ncbi:MAG: 5-formyltetrahydrofolate cyclo-ligase [Clostridia bacterium]|nr:5-formyltetrahydrofolate cyclo-ligase [Clostridia bacterium]
MQIKDEKRELRNKFRSVRAEVKSEAKDKRIYDSFIKNDAYINSDTVLIYYSVKSEADTLKIIDTALKDGKKVALPKCVNGNGDMDFYFVKDIGRSLVAGFYSLQEPDTSFCVKACFSDSTVCVVPALAVDKRGYRLGYGGGYYDRFLSNFKGIKLALCYDECICDELPCDKFDVKLDIVITDRNIYLIK